MYAIVLYYARLKIWFRQLLSADRTAIETGSINRNLRAGPATSSFGQHRLPQMLELLLIMFIFKHVLIILGCAHTFHFSNIGFMNETASDTVPQQPLIHLTHLWSLIQVLIPVLHVSGCLSHRIKPSLNVGKTWRCPILPLMQLYIGCIKDTFISCTQRFSWWRWINFPYLG